MNMYQANCHILYVLAHKFRLLMHNDCCDQVTDRWWWFLGYFFVIFCHYLGKHQQKYTYISSRMSAEIFNGTTFNTPLTLSLIVWMYHDISGTCLFRDVIFSKMLVCDSFSDIPSTVHSHGCLLQRTGLMNRCQPPFDPISQVETWHTRYGLCNSKVYVVQNCDEECI